MTTQTSNTSNSSSLIRDIKTAIAIILAVIAVIGFVKSDIDELRADMRENRAEAKEDIQNLREETRAQDAAIRENLQNLWTEMRDIRNLLMKHIGGHTHSSENASDRPDQSMPSADHHPIERYTHSIGQSTRE